MNYSITLTWSHLIWTVAGLSVFGGIMLIRQAIKSSRLREEEHVREILAIEASNDARQQAAHNELARNVPKTWLPLFQLVNDIKSGSSYHVIPTLISAYIFHPSNSLDPISYKLADYFISACEDDIDRKQIAHDIAPYVVANLMKNR